MKSFLLLTLCIGLSISACHAGEPDSLPVDTTRFRKTSLFVLPVVYYTPETRFGFGAAGLMAFRLPHEPEASRSSLLQGGAVYTQEKQILTYLSYVVYAKNEDLWSFGEVGYFRYTFFYFGNGNSDPIPAGELFDVNFPRLRIHALKRVTRGGYVGLHYWLDAFEIQNVAEGGLLANPVLNITGREGGVISGPGIIGVLDRREDFYAPNSGYYLEGLFQVNAPWTGSTFSYTRTTVDARAYLPVWKEKNHVLGLQAYADLTTGDAPFNALAQLGGPKRTRGYYEGRFRDAKLLSAQAEYRAHLFWRIGVTGFVAGGMVFDQFNEINTDILRTSYGGGLRVRISNRDRINLRVDAAFGGDQPAFYLTVGEAF